MNVIKIVLILLVLILCCSNTIETTVYDNELEAGSFDSSEWDRAKWSK